MIFSAAPARASPPLYVAGVGASAGGLEAMLSMFARMRPTGRIAYVVAQHMAKDGHDDLVVRLIGRESALPVVLAVEGEPLSADVIYVIPSGRDGVLKGNTLCLCDPAPGHLSTPSVNMLFASIAEMCQHRAVGIVLSGTGADGLAGCRAIKAAGGLTLAQDAGEAKFNGMPLAAINAGQIDRVLTVEQIGAALAALFPGLAVQPLVTGNSVRAAESDHDEIPEAAHRELELLLRQIHQATGIDFSSYKEETLLRRLERRKAVLEVDSAEAYQALIRRQPEELKILQHLFLVSVSSFFRDSASFLVLKDALVGMLAGKPAQEAVRVWVPGCASGEEAITLAIILKQIAANRPVEIVATDLNPEALAVARDGVYRQTAFKEMEPALRERYFTPRGQHFAVQPDIVTSIRYEQRDVLAAPATDLDLVSCRNLLIYMKSALQDKLVKRFHQALRSQGLLFIGQSESLGFIGNSLFAPIDHYHRLFRRRH